MIVINSQRSCYGCYYVSVCNEQLGYWIRGGSSFKARRSKFRKQKLCTCGLFGHAGKRVIWDDKKVPGRTERFWWSNSNLVGFEEKILIYSEKKC